MVLGSILSSTDPIAVGSVLKKAKAPTRLQMHIGGESLINDGSALVFYVIFTKQYLSDLNLGDAVTLGEGILLFLRMAVGGLTVGIAFAFGLCCLLHVMDSRLEPEYNIVQVVTALSIAYVSYYVAEQVCQMSGIIACVTCGITVRAVGQGLIREHHLMDSYLALMEHLLNTLLFALGGSVWGKAVAEGSLRASDWLFLIVFYIFVTIIRFVQIGLFYPIFSRIGLKSDWKEAAFLAYGGIRGGISIALALSLKGSVLPLTDDPHVERALSLLEFLAGGVTLLTLLVNGATAGPILRRLGLTKPIVSRKRAIRIFESSAKAYMNDEYAKIVSHERFARTRFRIVKAHVPFLSQAPQRERQIGDNESVRPASSKTLSQRNGFGGILSNRNLVSNASADQSESIRSLNLERKNMSSRKAKPNVRQLSAPAKGSDFFTKADETDDAEDMDNDKNDEDPIRNSEHMTRILSVRSLGVNEQLVEVRRFFLELIDQAYCDELELGEIDEGEENDGLNAYILRQSVAFASTDVDNQKPIHDWDYAKYNVKEFVSMSHWLDHWLESKEDRIRAQKYQHRRNNVLRCFAFIEAHQRAETRLKALLSTAGNTKDSVETTKTSTDATLQDIVEDMDQMLDDPEKPSSFQGSFDSAIEIVLKESKQQVKKAKLVLNDIPDPEIKRITSHYVCTILLHRLIRYVQQNIKDGLLSKKEGMLYLRQIDRSLQQSYTCTHNHSNESDIAEMLRQNSDANGAASHRHISARSLNSDSKPVLEPSDRVTAVMSAYLYKK
jgi:NhaP-type Na+/H+ or K+/H+ antiporter